MTKQGLSRGEDPLPHRAFPPRPGDGRIDLADDHIDHSVQELFFVGDVLVERHRYNPQLFGEPPHAQRLDPGFVSKGDGGS
jgi:hypothetical protein